MSDFAHLHVHSEYSTLDGINRVHSLPEYVRDTLGQKACALTDHGNLSGAYKFYKSCRAAGIKPILGIEAYYAVEDRTVREPDADGQNYYHMVLLAKNQTGFKNLIKLSSDAFSSGFYHHPRLDDALLAEHSEGILATTACLGSRSSFLIGEGRIREAEKLLTHHARIFKDNFFVELQLHTDELQQNLNKELIKLAGKHNWPLIITADSHYTHFNDKKHHELALAIQTNKTLSDPKRMTFGEIVVHMASHDWIAWHAERQGIPYEAISNTHHIANMIDDKGYFADIRNRYPKYTDLPEGVTADQALNRISKNLLIEKMGGVVPKVYQDRMNEELRIIKKMGFSDYMLIEWKLLKNLRDKNIVIGPGRGSVAGSLVAFALDITGVDPIKYDLLFSRWLNPGRAATPLIFTDDMISQISGETECETKDSSASPTSEQAGQKKKSECHHHCSSDECGH